MSGPVRTKFGSNVRKRREYLGITQESLAEAAGLDRSYIGGIERGERNPALTAILRLAEALRIVPGALFDGIGGDGQSSSLGDGIVAVPTNIGLTLRFKYDQYDAQYELPRATQGEFDEVRDALKSGLAGRTGKADAVARAFLLAVRKWPHANPSDLWTFLVNRAYCDRSNHPAANARLNLEQSWKRTSGWALERVLVSHYQSFLARNGVSIKISNKTEKTDFLESIGNSRIVPDKADVLVCYDLDRTEQLLGVIHVKASLAERRTDDVPMSQALIDAGYVSVFWTMDVKSMPGSQPINHGEFGDNDDEQASDKRRDFEEHGHFSACFSYNKSTIPTVPDKEAVARILVCDFTNPDDRFSRFLISALRHRLNSQS